MSTGLMSCVRENSPPLEMAAATEPTGAPSLSPSVSSSEQTNKRRRFHPLRNLRRIFRRRTLTSPIGNSNNDASSNTTQSNTTTPTHNLSSSVLLERTIPNLTLSSPSSPANSTISPYILMKSPTVPNYSTTSQQEQEQEHQEEEQTQQYQHQQQQQQTVPALQSSQQSIFSSTQQQQQQHSSILSGSGSGGGGGGGSNGSSRLNNLGMSERSPCGGVKILPTSSGGFPLNFGPPQDHIYQHHHHQHRQYQQYQHQQQSPTSSINLSVNSPRQCDNKIIINKSSTPLNSNKISNNINNNNSSNDKESMEDLNASSTTGNDGNRNNCEITDNQRSFSEGRLIDSDFMRDPLSQSHDSVFSESATASSLSIVLKNELFDVLRKRRNRPDTSDEDLGLPRSPSTPQRSKDLSTTGTTYSTANSSTNAQNQSEISSLSLLSAGSSDIEDEISSNYGGDTTSSNYGGERAISSLSTSTKIMQSTSFETAKSIISDEFDLSTTDGVSNTGRLSHSAAKHKMAIRPKKNKGPTRHRRSEIKPLPSTPEVNEDTLRSAIANDSKDLTNKEKSHSLPHGVNPKIINQQSDLLINSTTAKESNIKRSKTEKGLPQSNSYYFRHITKGSTGDKDLNVQKTQSDTGFFKRFLHRGSKGKGSTQSDAFISPRTESNLDEIDDIKFKQTNNAMENIDLQNEEITLEYSKQVEQTRNEIRREIMKEANSGLSLMLNNFILSKSESGSISSDKPIPSPSKPSVASNKPKSGPAARQRIMPKDITISPDSTFKSSTELREQHFNSIIQPLQHSDEEAKKVNIKYRFSDSSEGSRGSMEILKLSNMSLSTSPDYKYTTQINSSNEEVFTSETKFKEISDSPTEHFEKHHLQQSKSSNLYQQKLHRSENLLDNLLEVPKQRKAVEKSKSFRMYNGSNNYEINSSLQKSENMPSLPDLTFSRKSFEDLEHAEEASLSLGFEINDNNLINKNSRYSNVQEDAFPLRQGIFTKNIILTTVNPKQSKNISEIEDSIDKLLIKSPPQLLVRKSLSTNEAMSSQAHSQNIIVTHMYQKNNTDRLTDSKIPSASISIRTDPSKPIKITNSNQLSVSNALIKENRKSLIEISKFNDVEPLVKSNPSLMSKSLDSKSTTESMLGTTHLLTNKGSHQNLKIEKTFGSKEISPSTTARKPFEKVNEHDEEKRKSVDLDEIKKVFTQKHESSERVNSTSRPNSKEEIKDDTKLIDSKSGSNNKTNRSQSVADKSAGEKGLPEFMKIQLNKVAEPCRPKTNVVLSKIVKPPGEIERRQSVTPPESPTTESRPTSSENKPPLPPVPTELEKKRNSYVANISEAVTTPIANKLTSSATSRIRKSFEEEETVVLRSHHTTAENPTTPKYERRKSVNDEKLKYEKKIEEMQKSEKHTSIEIRKSSLYDEGNTSPIMTNNIVASPTNPTAIPASVLLRKKSLSLGNQVERNKDDSTPELMKVFARRSLKIKDEDIQAFVDETTNEAKCKTIKIGFSSNCCSSSSSGGGNLDSDKENQSSSEEKLNKLTKIEPHHHQQNQNINNQKLISSGGYTTKNNLTNSQRENNDKLQKNFNSINNCQNNNSNSISGNTGYNIFGHNNNNNNNNNSVHSTPTKAFNRFNSNNSNNVNNSNNRNSLSSVNNCNNNNNNNNKNNVTLRTTNITPQITTVTTIPMPSTGNINNNNNISNNSNDNNISNSSSNNNNNNNNNIGIINSIYNKKLNSRHTIGTTTATTTATATTQTSTINIQQYNTNIEQLKQTSTQHQQQQQQQHTNKTTQQSATIITQQTTTVMTPTTEVISVPNEVEFKGILQRRAEWEKRVKEAAAK